MLANSHNVKTRKISRVLRIILVIFPEHQSDTKVFTMTMEILPDPTSNKLCGRKRHKDAPIMRTTSTAAKPCQGDSLEFYLITDENGMICFQNSCPIYTEDGSSVAELGGVKSCIIIEIIYDFGVTGKCAALKKLCAALGD
ncbi:hypothetical protein Tco_0724241 [Tanacetum coccineum]